MKSKTIRGRGHDTGAFPEYPEDVFTFHLLERCSANVTSSTLPDLG